MASLWRLVEAPFTGRRVFCVSGKCCDPCRRGACPRAAPLLLAAAAALAPARPSPPGERGVGLRHIWVGEAQRPQHARDGVAAPQRAACKLRGGARHAVGWVFRVLAVRGWLRCERRGGERCHQSYEHLPFCSDGAIPCQRAAHGPLARAPSVPPHPLGPRLVPRRHAPPRLLPAIASAGTPRSAAPRDTPDPVNVSPRVVARGDVVKDGICGSKSPEQRDLFVDGKHPEQVARDVRRPPQHIRGTRHPGARRVTCVSATPDRGSHDKTARSHALCWWVPGVCTTVRGPPFGTIAG